MTASALPYRGRRVLVTGASGFIGRWVARLLGHHGAEVVVAVRSPDAMRAVATAYGIAAEALELDCTDRDAVRATVRRVDPVVAFHLAGYGVRRDELDEELSARVNADSVRWLAEAVAELDDVEWPGARLVHAGSALEYGAARGHLEETAPCAPTTLYGRTKLEGTCGLAAVCAASGLRGVTGRLFTVYGPGEDGRRLLPSLLDAARHGTNLPLTPGTQRRDFTWVEDAAEGLLRLGAANVPAGWIVNVATGKLHSVRQFVETAAGVLGLAPGRLHFGALPIRAGEMQHDEVSVERLRRATGWRPATSIAEGVRLTRAFVESHGDGSADGRAERSVTDPAA